MGSTYFLSLGKEFEGFRRRGKHYYGDKHEDFFFFRYEEKKNIWESSKTFRYFTCRTEGIVLLIVLFIEGGPNDKV